MKTKKCITCKKEKSRSEFYINRTRKDGLQNICKTCTKDYHKLHYKKNKRSYIEKNKKNQAEKIKFYNRVRKLSKCQNCGENRWYTLQFHHTEKNKVKGVFKMADEGYSITRLKEEMRKCDILCANCHIEKHFNERQGT